MKNVLTRWLSIVLSLVLCISVVFGINMPASAVDVDYAYAGSYIKNWGVRDTLATFLSQNAEGFYDKNGTSYDELLMYSGNSAVNKVPTSDLYIELKDLMTVNHKTKTSYNDTRDLFQYTDCQNSGKISNKISSFYSGVEVGPSWDGGTTWNREHTWPDSKGLEGDDEDDIMMLRPTSKSENSSRGNKAYGEGESFYDPNTESGGKHNLHGDVARIMLYQYVRWGNVNKMWGADGVIESVDVLLDWMEEDPVDTWELGRNDSVETITGTRNVFVDYPELAFLLFDVEIPDDYITPSGNAAEVPYQINAVSNNEAWGTVSLSGRVINAHPATGYKISGYTILSGSADVTQNGNYFVVNPSSDVKIRINFAASSKNSISFVETDDIVKTQTVYNGEVIILPEHTGEIKTGQTFVGWVTSTVDRTSESQAFYTAGSQFTVSEDTVMYALYSEVVEDGTSTSNLFIPYNGEITEGDYIMVYDNGAMMAETTSKNRLQYHDITLTDGNIICNEDKIIWRVTKNGNYWTLYNESTAKYAAGTGVKNVAGLIDRVDDFAKWTISGTKTYTFVNYGNEKKGVNAHLRRNGTVGFACYAASFGKDSSLYKRVSGTLYYFTIGEIDCRHTYTADCDNKCNICNKLRKTTVEHEFDQNDVCINCGSDKIDYVSGDINGDSAINNKDLGLLMQHLNNWNVQIVELAADVNRDASINNKDYGLLMQYLNNWNVELK